MNLDHQESSCMRKLTMGLRLLLITFYTEQQRGRISSALRATNVQCTLTAVFGPLARPNLLASVCVIYISNTGERTLPCLLKEGILHSSLDSPPKLEGVHKSESLSCFGNAVPTKHSILNTSNIPQSMAVRENMDSTR